MTIQMRGMLMGQILEQFGEAICFQGAGRVLSD